MLALQHSTNQKLKDLEIANEEKTSLLRAALLDRENLSPELLELKRAETLRYIREQIDAVIQAPAEVQPKVFETTSSEIAETVLSSEAALDKAKQVSTKQLSHEKSPSSAFDSAVSTMKRYHLDPSFSASTLIPASPAKSHTGKHQSLSGTSVSTAGTGQTSWRKATHLMSSARRRESTRCSTEYFSALTSNACVASLSLARLPLSIFIFATVLFRLVPLPSLLADGRSMSPVTDTRRRIYKSKLPPIAPYVISLSSRRKTQSRRAQYVSSFLF